MYKKVEIRSPAKINIHLEIRNKRRDGYHNLISIFHMVSLFDTITICSLKKNSVCEITGNCDIPTQQNLVCRAVTQFRKATGVQNGVSIELKKNIPLGAGFGGGSSNAASTLIGLNKLFDTDLSTVSLSDLGLKIGSDVPFFCKYPAAVVTGRGESILEIEARPEIYGVIVKPDFSISTENAYKWYDEEVGKGETRKTEKIGKLLDSYKIINIGDWDFCNSFTDVICSKYKSCHEIINDLNKNNVEFISMTGSGSAFYALSTNEAKIDELADLLKNKYSFLQKIKLLASLPSAVLQ
jgi:4-diphosphocytidyl-2-C-methyl-D-erythritol kinase